MSLSRDEVALQILLTIMPMADLDRVDAVVEVFPVFAVRLADRLMTELRLTPDACKLPTL
jgi:hypothetical protein